MKEIDNLSNIKLERQLVIEELENQKQEVLNAIDKTFDQIEEMKKSEVIQEFLKLRKKVKKLRSEAESIEDDIYIEKILNCDHIFANTKLNKSTDIVNGRLEYTISSSQLCCIKCGLNWKWRTTKQLEKMYINSSFAKDKIKAYKGMVARTVEKNNNLISLNPEQYLSYDLAKAIYERIIECNPGIDDTTAKVYFECAQKNILTKDMPMEKHKDRVRRLNAYIWPKDRCKN